MLSQIEDLKCEPNGILYCPINGKYCCLPLETEFDHDAYEISMNEYYQYLIDGEDDKVAEDYDEDGNTVYYYYNSKTAKQNYILIEKNLVLLICLLMKLQRNILSHLL